MTAPFVVYADFESVLEPLSSIDTTQVYKIVSSVDHDFSRLVVMYRGEDAAEKFVRDLQKEAEQLNIDYIKTPKPMIFSIEDSLAYTAAATCHICSKELGDDSVCDHCHITGNLPWRCSHYMQFAVPTEPKKLEVARSDT